MQLTLFILYLLSYICLIFQLICLFLYWLPYILYTRGTINICLAYIRVYTPLWPFISFLFLNLSGIPPLFFFFFKFILLGYLFQSFNIFFCSCFFIFFFLNILFYLQFFKLRAFKTSFISKLYFENLSILRGKQILYPATKQYITFFFYLLQTNQKVQYSILYWISFCNCFFLLSYSFFCDFYLIIYNFGGF